MIELDESVETLTEDFAAPKSSWLIWSIEHNSFWRPNRMGYTFNRKDAGRYTLTEAREIVKEANKMVPDEPAEAMIFDE